MELMNMVVHHHKKKLYAVEITYQLQYFKTQQAGVFSEGR